MKRFIARLHEDLRRARASGRGSHPVPENGATQKRKKYPRMPRIALPIGRSAMTLQEALAGRSSAPLDVASNKLSQDALGVVLGFSMRMNPDGHRPYPSGGSHYPIEAYVLIERGGATRGVYHYDPAGHALERLWDMPVRVRMRDLFVQPDIAEPAAVIVLTALWERSSPKYGDFAYQLALLEAGHVGQNMLLSAHACGTPARPVAGFDDGLVAECLDIDTDHEQPVYTIVLP